MAGICLTFGKRGEIEGLYNDDVRPSEIAAAVGAAAALTLRPGLARPGHENRGGPHLCHALVYAGLDWAVEQKNGYAENGTPIAKE